MAATRVGGFYSTLMACADAYKDDPDATFKLGYIYETLLPFLVGPIVRLPSYISCITSLLGQA